MTTIFSRIVAGEIPCHKIDEDDRFLAFLDINPLAEGHTLVIPKKEVDYIFDMEDDDLGALHVFAKKVAIKMKRVLPCERIGVSVIGLEVPHAHVHLIPIFSIAEMDFSRPKLELKAERFEELAMAIRNA